MAAVRDEDQLVRPGDARESRRQLRDDTLDVIGLVVNREDERDQDELPRATASRIRRTVATIAPRETP